MTEPIINLNMDKDKLNEIVTKAIMDSLDAKTKENVIAQAVAFLNKPKEGGYYDPKWTPLQDAFNRAVEVVARDVSIEMVRNDPQLRAKIKELLDKAISKVMEKSDDEVANTLARSIISWLSKEKSY